MAVRKTASKRAAERARDEPIGFFDVTRPLDSALALGTEGKILDAGRRCIIQFGFGKMSMNDVARFAGLSRASVYKYFPDRQALVEQVLLLAFTEVSKDLDEAMSTGETFGDRVANAAICGLQWALAAEAVEIVTQEREAQIFTTDSGAVLAALMPVFTRHAAAAQERGEVRQGLRSDQVAEWVCRLILSLASTPAVTFDRENPAELTKFVKAHLVAGLG